MILEQFAGTFFCSEQECPDRLVDFLRRTLAEMTGLGELASEEGMFLALAQIHRPHGIGHPPARDHCPGQRGGTVDIVIRARTDAAKQQFL